MMVADRRFSPFYWTQFLAALVDNVFKNALVIMVTFKGVTVWGLDKGSVVALAGGLFVLPFFLFSHIAGQISDRLEKSRLVRATKYWEVLIMAVAAFGFYFHHFNMLLGVLFLAGVQASLFGPVKYSILPELVEPGHLMEANAYVEGGTFLAILVGTIGGGVLVALPRGELAVAAALVLLALGGLATSLFVTRVSAAAPDLKISYNPGPNFKSLYAILKRNPELMAGVLVISWFWFFGAALLSILPVYCKDSLHVNENVVTSLLAMFTIGIGVGSLLCERLSHGRVKMSIVPYAAAGMSAFLGDLYFISPSWPLTGAALTFPEFAGTFAGIRLLADFFLMCVAGGVFILPLYTLLQQRGRSSERSRVIASNNIMNAVFMVGASACVMAFNGLKLSHAQMFGVLAIFNLGVGVLVYRTKSLA